jgi:heptosyltransferase-2
VLLVHLGALGAVVRSTSLLPAIHRKYPGAHITWVTDGPGDILLQENPLVDRVICASSDGALALSALTFDVALVIDKSLKAAGLLGSTTAREVFGFTVDPLTGSIIPVNEGARELWELGLSNQLKFNVNRKPETRLVHEALELGEWKRDRYALHLSSQERSEVLMKRYLWSLGGTASIIGVNTGCASTIAAKKLSVDGHVKLLVELDRIASERFESRKISMVLLGGKEDTIRNREIKEKASQLGLLVTESPTEYGLRSGMMSVAACDVVVSGDSLGLHMALGFGKPVVAWFGPTCAHEIDLYGGVAIQTSAACAPCWKRSCDKATMCYDQVDFSRMASEALSLAFRNHEKNFEKELSRPASLEITPQL